MQYDVNKNSVVTFDVHRGVIQGDIMSPVLFILALDQLIQAVWTQMGNAYT